MPFPIFAGVQGVVGPLLYQSSGICRAGRPDLRQLQAQRFEATHPERISTWACSSTSRSARANAIEFRAEGFNVFNHTQWTGVNTGTSCFGGTDFNAGDAACLANNNFLRPGGAHNPRILQLGLKFLF